MYSSGGMFPGERPPGERDGTHIVLRSKLTMDEITLGAFRLVEPVGSGAMAHVWRAEHRGLGTSVAVKVLTRADSPDVPALFAHEVRAVARLSHPAIIRLHDHGTIPPEVAAATDLPVAAPYLIMEWLPGGSLRQRAASLRWREIRRTLLVLLDALGHAHARGVIHRDLKPDNVLLSERGPVLTDFGVAASLDEAQGARLLVGTPNYMAPEQIRGDWRALGSWTDLYAVGCLAWQLVTGTAPFAGAGRQAVLKAHLNQDPPAFVPRLPVPEGFEAWVRMLLVKAPQGRPRFAAMAAHALLALDEPTSLDPPEPSSLAGSEELTVVAPSLPAGEVRWVAVGQGEVLPVPSQWRPPASPRPPLPLPGVGRALVSLREVGLQGRDPERDLLWKALRRVAERGRTQVVLLEGPAGYGKSRLATWLVRRAHELGVAEAVVARHARQPGPGTGLGPMLARALRCSDLPAEARLSRIIDLIGQDEAEDETAFLPALAALTDSDGSFAGGNERVVLASEAERFATLRRGLVRLAGGRPLIMHLDDLQWGSEALRFTHALLASPDALPLLVVGTISRDAIEPGWAASLEALRRDRAVKVIEVGPLPPEALVGICRAILPLGADAVHRLIERAEGSPLFAEEMIRHWIRTDALDSTAEGFQLKSAAEGDVPGAVGVLWEARLAEVLGPSEPAAWYACELAAALGMAVDWAEWKALCQLAEVHLAPDLPERLQAASLLLREPEEGRLRFAHPMVREALRARSVSTGRFLAWNSLCADLIELSPAPEVERLAHHLLAARRWREALEPLAAAARRHLERGEHLAARRLIVARARTLRLLHIHPCEAAWLDTRLAWAEQAAARGEFQVARRQASRVLATATPGRSRVSALVVLGRIDRLAGFDGQARLTAALTEAEAVGEPGLLGQARLEAAWCLAGLGRLAEAEVLARQVVRTDVVGGDALRAEARHAVASIAWRRDRVHQALMFAEAAFAGYRGVGSRAGMAQVAQLLGDIARARGDRSQAEQRYRESLALVDAAGGLGRGRVLGSLALVHLGRGDVGQARVLLIEGRQDTLVAQGLRSEPRRDRRQPEVRPVRVGERARLDFFLLICDAQSARWRSCEARLEAAESLRAAPEPDVAELARGLARLAEGAGRTRVADVAWELAEVQLAALGREAEVDALVSERLEASRRRHWPGKVPL